LPAPSSLTTDGERIDRIGAVLPAYEVRREEPWAENWERGRGRTGEGMATSDEEDWGVSMAGDSRRGGVTGNEEHEQES